MPKLLNAQGQPQADAFEIISEPSQIPEDVSQPLLVSLALWQEQRARLQAFTQLGVLLASDQFAEQISADLAHFVLVGIEFPKFADGRGYSTARLLRERYGYTGELRACGDVLLDQLLYLRRCGFSQFSLRDDQQEAYAPRALTVLSDQYQSSVDQPQPLFKRRALA